MSQIVLNGNNIDLLKQYPDNYFDAVVTDPPYGLGKEPNAEEVMKGWIEKGYHEVGGSGFMGKEWDAFIPQPIFWKEVFRVLKHGGHVVSFFGTRTYDWGVMSMRFAGFEVRDCIQWLYGSGFPKSHNISKAIDKMYGAEREVIGERQDILKKQAKDIELGKRKYVESLNMGASERNNGFINVSAEITAPSTDEAKQWSGWGSALKPANEPIVLARKPLEKGLSISENVLKWGVGGINIDGCRVVFRDETDKRVGTDAKYSNTSESEFFKSIKNNQQVYDSQGRFPANLILTHHPECECKGLKKVKGMIDKPTNRTKFEGTWNEGNSGLRNNTNSSKEGYADENGEETIEHWECHPECPIKIMDEQSGVLKSGGGDKSTKGKELKNYGIYGKYTPTETKSYQSDTGGASRFFYCAKASKSERNNGLDGFEEKRPDERTTKDMGVFDEKGVGKQSNFHPTVKPVKLMQYLARLITPPNGKVLDPFCGSGTTGIACKLEGFEFVGMEQDAEYTKIAQARIEKYQEEPEEPLELIQEDSNGRKIIQTSLF